MKWSAPADEDEETDDSSSLMSDPEYLPTALHRKSVAAERFNPESDEDDDDIPPTFPKSDAQRKLLREKMIFYFLVIFKKTHKRIMSI